MRILSLLFVIFVISTNLYSKDKVAVLPFVNQDGNLKYEIWCYDLQDSLYKAMESANIDNELYELIPIVDVEMTLAQLNIDPTNPQYKSDIWKAAKELGATKVVTGNFNFQAGRFLINAYIYDTKFKFPDPNYQAKNIFKSEENIYESINEITGFLLPAWKN